MDGDLSKEFQPNALLERAQSHIFKILGKIDLVAYFPKDAKEKRIAILGAGLPIEVEPLTDYFTSKGFAIPRIVAFDKEMSGKVISDLRLKSKNVKFEYRAGEGVDISNSNTFGRESYDMIIMRNPDVHNSPENWERAIGIGFDHLKTEGVFLATTDLYSDFVLAELRRGGEIVKSYIIPTTDKVSPFFNESDLFVAQKRDS